MKEKLRRLANRKILLLFSIAVVISLVMTAFPLNIQTEDAENAIFRIGTGDKDYYITIGSPVSAQTADYTCDGTADDVTFQTAIDALPATGGQLFVLAGTYNWQAATSVTRAIDNISIVGIGAAVLFDGDDSTVLFTAGGNDWLFSDLETDAGSIDMGATTDWMWLNVKVDTTKYTLRTPDISIIDGNVDLGGTDTTLARASAGDVNIEGNIIYRAGGTDVPVTDGGTGSSTASGARTNLGLAIGSDVQAYDAGLADIAGLAVTNSNFIVGDGANWVAESGATARTSLGLGNVEDTAISTWSGSGNIATVGTVGTGVWSATDVAVAAGGTGASTASDARTNLGLAIGSDVQAYDAGLADIAGLAVTDSNFIVGDGANWVAETGATVRTSLGLVIGTDVLAQQTIGIADNNLLEVDDASAADDDFARFTADGLEGLTDAQTLAALSGDAGATFDWNGQTLADWGIEYGSTLDASPTQGQLFLHTPTGRNILYQYDGSNWVSIQSFGTMTLYVDATDGSDSLTDHGHAVDGDAFDTVQFAIDCIPGVVGGSVTIHINGNSYDEDITVRGKSFTGDYTITLQGTLSSQEAPGTDATVTANSGATQGTVAHADFNGDDYSDMLVYFEDDDEYRVIDSHATTTLTVVGTCPSSTAQEVTVYNWGTDINKIEVGAGQQGVFLYDIELDDATGLVVTDGAEVNANNMKLSDTDGSMMISVDNSGHLSMYSSYITHNEVGADYMVEIHHFGYVFMGRSKVYGGTASDRCMRLHDSGQAYLTFGCILDAASSTSTYCIEVKAGCVVNLYASPGGGYNRVDGAGIGLYCEAGGTIFNTSNIQDDGVTTLKSPLGASDPSYID